jgi:hypothetical protein
VHGKFFFFENRTVLIKCVVISLASRNPKNFNPSRFVPGMVSSDYVPSPTFSDRVKRKREAENKENKKVWVKDKEELPSKPEPKKPLVNLPSFPEVVRTHHLPLVLKSKSGDSLQVYLLTAGVRDEEGVLVYDVEFDDKTVKKNVPRSALTIPAATSYQIMRLQESQQSASTPKRPSKNHRSSRR